MNIGTDIFFHRALVKILQEQLDRHRDELIEGVPRDYAEFRYLTGLIQGLREAVKEADELRNRIIHT